MILGCLLSPDTSSSKCINVAAHFASVILLNNVLSLQPERPHLHHFATKWNKFSFDKPAGPLLAVELSQSNKMSVGSMKPVSLSFTLVFRCVLRHPFYLSPFPNSFPAENEFLSAHGGLQKIRNAEINY